MELKGYSTMDMQAQAPDIANLTVQGLLKIVQDATSGVSTICSSTDFVARHVIRPAVEASVNSYLHTCAADGETLISDTWSLCGTDDLFNCDNIFSYTSQCRKARQDCLTGSNFPSENTPKRVDGDGGFSMAGLMESPAGVALLVGLVLLGILIGMASTIAVCLIWPKLHTWANAKLRSEKSDKSRVYRGDSVNSGSYYTDIDEKQRQLAMHPLQMSSSGGSNSSVSILSKPRPRHHSDPAYADSDWLESRHAPYPLQPGYHTEPEPDYYDQIRRDSERKQSHKYAQIHVASPKDNPDDYHSYFVLEKNI